MAVTADKVVIEMEARLAKFLSDTGRARDRYVGDVAAMEAATAGMESDIASHLAAIGPKLERQAVDVKKLSDAYRSGSLNTANAAAQFQDVAVSLQGGQSVLQVMLQQGSQLSQVFQGPGGVSGAISTVGAALKQMFNPISLITYGVIGLAGAVYKWVSSMGEDLPSLEDRLKTHESLISRIKDAWNLAEQGVADYVEESGHVALSELGSSVTALTDELRKLTEDVIGEFASFNARVGGYFLDAGGRESLGPFANAVNELIEQFRTGEPDIRAFRERIAEIAAESPDEEVQRLKDRLFELTKEASGVQGRLQAAANVIDAVGAAALRNTSLVDGFRAALQEIQGLSLPNLSPNQRADVAYAEARQKARNVQDPVLRRRMIEDADAELAAQRRREQTANMPLPVVNPYRDLRSPAGPINGRPSGGGGKTDAEKEAEAIAKVIENLEFLEAQLDRTEREQFVFNELQKAGIDASHAEADAVRAAAEAYYDKKDAIDAAKEAAEELNESLRFGMDVLKGFASDLFQFDLRSAAASRSQDLLKAAQQANIPITTELRTQINGLSEDYAKSQRLAEAAANALQKLADKLLDKGFDLLSDALFGPSGGKEGTGLLGGIIGRLIGGIGGGGSPLNLMPKGFSRGGITDRPAIFGENGAEAAVPLPDGRRIPVDLGRNNRRPEESAMTFAPQTTIVAGDGTTRAEIQRMLDERDRAFYRALPTMIKNKSGRGQL